MTRIFTDGAEMGDLLFWDYIGNAQVESGTPSRIRSGAYSYKLQDSSYLGKIIPDLSELYFRIAHQGVGDSEIFRFAKDSTNIVSLKYINSATSQRIALYINDAWVKSGTSLINYAWKLIEIHFVMADSGSVEVKIDGISEISYSGDTKPGADAFVNYLRVSCPGWNWLWFADDLALNDTAGGVDDSWCRDGVVLKIYPSGSSATTNNWLNSGSVSGSANYLYVDEFPKDDDTTYVYASGSNTGVQDQYVMSDLTLTGKTILRVWVEARAKKTVADSSTVKIGFLANEGTDVMSDSLVLGLTYARISGSAVKINPVTSASWTNTDLNALEAVIEVG